MRILLVHPHSQTDLISSSVNDIPYVSAMMGGERHASFAPHALVTVAALTPEEHDVTVHDEQVLGPIEPVLDRDEYDIIGITTIANQLTRTLEITAYCREKSVHGCVVVGGAGTTNLPPSLKDQVDVIFYGEVEETWPRFLKQYAEGRHASRYQHIARPDLSQTPPPRWEAIKDTLSCYGAAAVQTTRGCPFDCSFCDVIYIYGRKQRHKPVDHVIQEVRTLSEMGVKMILFADDNFVADKPYCKELLRKLSKLTRSFEFPVSYITQADLTMARDEELLELMADCNFIEVLVGIESENAETLKLIGKKQNQGGDTEEAIRKIQSYGIAVLGSMIIGADSDDTSAFQRTLDFVTRTHLVDHACHPLMAPSGTRLWYELKREGRLVRLTGRARDKLDVTTNIVPKKMTRAELMRGLADYWEEVFSPERFRERAIGFINGVTRVPKVNRPRWITMLRYSRMMFHMLFYFTFRVSAAHRRAFFDIMRAAKRKGDYMVPKMVFLHTSFLASHNRAKAAAKLAREQVEWEEAHPETVVTLERELPIPQPVRDAADELFAEAYQHLRPTLGSRTVLYDTVLEAMTDYVSRFGTTFQSLDDFHRQYIRESCDRALARNGKPAAAENVAGEDLPEDRPPAGFTRAILDGLDHALRTA